MKRYVYPHLICFFSIYSCLIALIFLSSSFAVLWTLGYQAKQIQCCRHSLVYKKNLESTCWQDGVVCDMLPVWVLLYAAERCSFDSHARNLAKNNCGEFISILWLVFRYHIPPVVTASKDLIKLKEAEQEEDGIGEEELKQYDGSDPHGHQRQHIWRHREQVYFLSYTKLYPNMHAFPLFSSVIDQTNEFVAFAHEFSWPCRQSRALEILEAVWSFAVVELVLSVELFFLRNLSVELVAALFCFCHILFSVFYVNERPGWCVPSNSKKKR